MAYQQPLPEYYDATPIPEYREELDQSTQSSTGSEQFASIDDLIRKRSPEAIGILREGQQDQLRLAQLGQQAGIAPLTAAMDMRPYEEQQALLGLRGREAQEQAIGGIPVSEFDRELQKRQRQQLRRKTAAAGEVGGGASFVAQSQLAGAQQADFIQNRLNQLMPLIQLQRGLSQDVSRLQEQGLTEQANIEQGLGAQIGNIRLGSAADQIASRMESAELSGLRRIQDAKARAAQNQQLASLAGTIAGGG